MSTISGTGERSVTQTEHMRSFSLVAESRDGQQYTHNDTGGPAQQVYMVVPSPTISFPVHTVLIRARQGQPLALCEIDTFGETVCRQGQFGLRCQWACNCLHTHSCLSHSGGCPYGCANGFHGEDCYTPKD
ncbi:hypothetical protein RRG08_063872 [Elysia crispata]|uniref:Uncharacterized protein n=1 Tax=Elysia crispata TaxID=231223 RepID=A0AAE1AAW5_9GAST|nr:hypothetical protein RRG08_063872 [Elysia crispata]